MIWKVWMFVGRNKFVHVMKYAVCILEIKSLKVFRLKVAILGPAVPSGAQQWMSEVLFKKLHLFKWIMQMKKTGTNDSKNGTNPFPKNWNRILRPAINEWRPKNTSSITELIELTLSESEYTESAKN